MHKLLIGVAASVLAIAVAPAAAQVAPSVVPQAHVMPMGMKAHTRAEVQARIAKHFARLDGNRDGFITKAEADARRAQAHHNMGQGHAGKLSGRTSPFDRLDANRDGAISRAEFDAAHAQRMARRDRDGDGQPDRMHGGRRVGHMGGLHGRLFEKADLNRDGRVSLQEATNAALQHFDKVDVNHDGQLTPQERQQMHRRMRSEHRPG